MRKFYLFSRCLTVLLVLITTLGWSQVKTVTGKVTSADDGSGLPGVNVVEKGTSNGTVTDTNGSFSVSVGANSTLVFSFVGYVSQEIVVGNQTSINVSLVSDVTSLSEVVVVGYGTQEKKEITSSVVQVDEKQFNKGNINDPSQLLAGKVAGLSVYNRGGDPNSASIVRLRGISTVGANTAPLVVVDGVIGASLNNVDPADIESINVLKDGSGAAIYGSRGSSGVIIVTTKKGKSGTTNVDYNGYVAASTVYNQQPVMTKSEYLAAGGNDLGGNTDWQKEVTQTGVSNVHNLAISGGNQATTFRISTNFRNVDGVLKKSGFDQVNARANLSHRTLRDKLKFDLNMSLTNRNIDYSFNDALRYAVLYNPTAPIKFDNGNYYQAILFDNFNPVAILEQNVNEGKRKSINYNAQAEYSITDNLSIVANYGQQFETQLDGSYYSRNSLFRGYNRGGLARRYTSDRTFSLFESYAKFSSELGDKLHMDLAGGYSYQQDNFQDIFMDFGNFPNDQLGYNALENSGDKFLGGANGGTNGTINSSASPDNKIIALFARANFTFDDAIFLNASVRREGSTKLGENNKWGVFPAVGVGVDLNKYLQLNNVEILKFRAGYGVTGALPNDAGLSKNLYNYSTQSGGTVTRARDANPDLKWEQKAETNLGVDFGLGKKFTGTLDVYSRDIKDFILTVRQEATGGSTGNDITKNAGSLQTRGIELALNYSMNFGGFSWTPGVVLSSYKTVLKKYLPGVSEQMRAELGAPGQNGTFMIRTALDEEVGQIWGPVFDKVNEATGAPIFKDLNGDGVINAVQQNALQDDADFKVLGKGIPSLELGWTNLMTYKNWDFNVFFRGAFGHSLVNNYRAFYEPVDKGAINSYNRIKTDKAVAGLTNAQFSSLYVEKADFFKLDNLTIGYKIPIASGAIVKNFRLYASGQNLFVITSYTGIDPEPVLADPGTVDNGNFPSTNPPDVLSPGIDRRNNYFTSRTFTFGVTLGL